MTVRSITIGVLLGLAIAMGTYFNDQVIGQTFLIGNNFPPAVFGVGLVLLLGLNPLLRIFGARYPLRPAELAIIMALGSAVCAWPGSNLLRIYTELMALPAHDVQGRPAWQAAQVMSYVPGGSPNLAAGYIKSWSELLEDLHAAAKDPPTTPAGRIWAALPKTTKQLVGRQSGQGHLNHSRRRTLLKGLNAVIADPHFYVPAVFSSLKLHPPAQRLIRIEKKHALSSLQTRRLNRALFTAIWPQTITPTPKGTGVLLQNGNPTPAVLNPLLSGSEKSRSPFDVPWAAWWPSIRLWLGVALFVGLASLCMMLVVHPQWSRRELLPYPTVQVIQEVTNWTPGAWLPDIAKSRLFWIGLGMVVMLHAIDGLHAWFPALPYITRQFDFNPLRTLFPIASSTHGSQTYFSPTLYPAAIGLGYFIQTRVATSLGLAPLFWMLLSTWMFKAGVVFRHGRMHIGANGVAMLFGAWVAMGMLILYYGRRYYARLLMATVGARRSSEVPLYAVWSARLGVLFTAAAWGLLIHYAGLDALLAGLLLLTVLMALLVLARINVETGLFFIETHWIPGIILAGFFGYQGLGPSSLVVLGLAGIILLSDPRSAISPFIINALGMTERIADVPPRRTGWMLGSMAVVGLVVAFVTTLTIQYNLGMSHDGWAHWLPVALFNHVSHGITRLTATGQLAQATALTGLGHFTHAQTMQGIWLWAFIGIGLVLACAAARIAWPWWPIHPLLFLVACSSPLFSFAVSFLVAALIKWAVVRVGGERAYNRYKPLMVGLIAGDLLMILFWSGVGAIYYKVTGLSPPPYKIWPG